MKPISLLALTATIFAASQSALAQFTGPAPLSFRWFQPTTTPPGGKIVAKEDLIYIASGSRVYAIDRITGNQKWRFPVAEPISGHFRSGVVMAGDVLVAATDTKEIYALDPATGQQKWMHPAEAPVNGAPVASAKAIIYSMTDGAVMAISQESGSPIMQNPLHMVGGIIGNIGVYNDNIILITGEQELVSLSIGAQKKNWGAKLNQITGTEPVIFGDRVYMTSGDFIISVSAIDGRSPRQINTMTDLQSNPAVSDSAVAAVSRDGMLVAFTPSGQKILAKPVDLQSGAVADLSIVGNLVAAPTANGDISLISLKDGSLLWRYTLRSMEKYKVGSSSGSEGKGSNEEKVINFVQAAEAPLFVKGSMIVVGRDGSIFNFDKDNGVDMTPPDIKMVYPTPGDAVKGSPPFYVNFTVNDDASGVNPGLLKVSVDDTKVDYSINKDGVLVVKFSNEGKNRPLGDGRHLFKVEATDWLGNVGVKEFSFTIDSTLPAPKKAADDNGGGAGRPGGNGVGGGGGGRGRGGGRGPGSG